MSSRPLWRRLPGYRYPGVGVGGAGVTLAGFNVSVGWVVDLWWWICWFDRVVGGAQYKWFVGGVRWMALVGLMCATITTISPSARF